MITLRDLAMDDVPAIQRIYSGASVRFTHDRPYTAEEARERVAKALELAEEVPRRRWDFGIVLAEDDDLLGVMSLRIREPGVGTLSYILREDAWNSGYATEAAERVVEFAFTTAGLKRLEAKHHPRNLASGRVLTKAGFECIGTSELHTTDGVIVPYPVYAFRGPSTTQSAGEARCEP
ncbi:GNAT family N-acetyltransferase [Streptomyces coeruleoprunus]|uniref:GNAT family N-acetyltransferase n=1 Tax=Streptomyces coeruleoprunus TaxID=285563 RepID=A0ABV9XL20_9ACTN